MANGLDDFTHDQLSAFSNAYIATVSGDLASYAPLLAADMTGIGGMRDNYGDSILDADQKREASKGATVTQNNNRKLLLAELRRQRDLLKANGCPEDKFAALGFPTGGGPSGEGASSVTVPIATVDTSKRLQHTINWADASSPNIKRRLKGVKGCQIWNKVDGALPGSEIDCNFLALDSATPYTVQYPPEHAGKTVHYMLRWQFNDDTVSPWGETVSATITE